MNKSGIALVITGFSGVGKDTVIDILTTHSSFKRFPSCTTRSPRPGEIDGVHYKFLDERSFSDLNKDDKLLDHVTVAGKHYGLPLYDLQREISDGQNVVMHLTVESTSKLRKVVLDTVSVFIMPPSHAELIRRLRIRGVSEEEISQRLKGDQKTTMYSIQQYDLVVVNHCNDEQQTARRILDFIRNLDPYSSQGKSLPSV